MLTTRTSTSSCDIRPVPRRYRTTTLNFGFGATNDGTWKGSDKYENRWVYFEGIPTGTRRGTPELLRLSKKDLADLVCRLEAGR